MKLVQIACFLFSSPLYLQSLTQACRLMGSMFSTSPPNWSHLWLNDLSNLLIWCCLISCWKSFSLYYSFVFLILYTHPVSPGLCCCPATVVGLCPAKLKPSEFHDTQMYHLLYAFESTICSFLTSIPLFVIWLIPICPWKFSSPVTMSFLQGASSAFPRPL